MTHRRSLYRITVLLLTACLVLTGCAASQTRKSTQVESGPSLSVAIYPYLPDTELFCEVLTRQWAQLEPDVALNFVDWDCYVDASPEQIDVIMYDAMFTSHLAEHGYIQPISEADILDREGILPFAVEGAYHDGELYGLPYLVCSFFLIHHADDPELSSVNSMGQLCDVLQARKDADPEDGLLLNYGSDYPYHYLDALIDFSGEYTVYEDAPSTEVPDPEALETLRAMAECQAEEAADYGKEELGTFRKGALFNDGVGAAYYGYSEDICFMEDILDEITIRTISFSETDNIQLFFADIASMGAHVTDPAKKELCIRLMNLISSEAFLQELCFGTGEAQYMLPARQNVYIQAMEAYPMYERLYELAMDDRNQILRFGESIHAYLSTAYEDLA